MKTLDSLGVLQTFVQVADTLSFVETGRLQGVSASAVGKAIARLEQQLGVRLFHRSTRSVALTAEGQLFLARCRRALDELELAEAELTDPSSEPRGTLRVSLPLASSLLLPVLSDFMQAYPQVRLDLDFDDRLVDVIDEGFDAVLRVGEPGDSRLSARRIGTFRRLLVASPEYLARQGTPREPADLQQHECLHYRFPTSGKLERWPTPPEVEIPVSMVCNDVDTRVCFAQRGRGIAYVPEHAVRAALASGELLPVLDDYAKVCGTFYLLWPSGRHMLPKLRAFVDFVGERLL
ncbi:LysR family transcriptional regulator [Dyella sp. LX-66]|uniref:LysR family transcriptional regulator n=1 Tax=unclassified Dyella TaxID=2634549 RepID=UPI001BDFFFFF|nr:MULTISPECIES: LysR family transcriptional regulator [unclassified Dyella]MBT2117616.1 LysR family transcriptional regulator [Dyella sp. LX-1]MBT2141380.1 LysR family transcriptional regulator [Dyella sp. LX-66]